MVAGVLDLSKNRQVACQVRRLVHDGFGGEGWYECLRIVVRACSRHSYVDTRSSERVLKFCNVFGSVGKLITDIRQHCSFLLHSTIMSDKIREFIEVPQQFIRDGNQVCLWCYLCPVFLLKKVLPQFLTRCTKPSQKGWSSLFHKTS